MCRTQSFNCVRAVQSSTINANVITQIAEFSFRRWINLYDTLLSQFTYSRLFIRAWLEFRTRKAHGTHTLTHSYSIVQWHICRAGQLASWQQIFRNHFFHFLNFYYNQQMHNCIITVYVVKSISSRTELFALVRSVVTTPATRGIIPKLSWASVLKASFLCASCVTQI